ncbi:MAG: FHA domain-containing protein, partial [Acidimicrobiales bacterium]|nr:FHA domain-containing protein [Acidimicrobiales bacterium]
MPDSLLTVLRLLLLTLIWLFFVRVLFLLAAKPKPMTAVATPAPSTPAAAPPPAGRGGASGQGKANLRVTSGGEHAGKEFVVATEATIGRGQGCQVQLSDSMVSQLHARLFRDGKGLHIEDLGSTNGTYLNGRKVGGPAKLKKG